MPGFGPDSLDFRVGRADRLFQFAAGHKPAQRQVMMDDAGHAFSLGDRMQRASGRCRAGRICVRGHGRPGYVRRGRPKRRRADRYRNSAGGDGKLGENRKHRKHYRGKAENRQRYRLPGHFGDPTLNLSGYYHASWPHKLSRSPELLKNCCFKGNPWYWEAMVSNVLCNSFVLFSCHCI